MEHQQELVATGPTLEVPNDPGYVQEEVSVLPQLVHFTILHNINCISPITAPFAWSGVHSPSPISRTNRTCLAYTFAHIRCTFRSVQM